MSDRGSWTGLLTMLETAGTKFPINLLNLAAYLGMVAVGVAGIASMPPGIGRWVALGLLIAFGMAYRVMVVAAMQSRQRVVLVCLALQIALVTLMSVLDPSSSSATNNFSILFFILSAEVMLVLPQKIAIVSIVIFSLVSAAVFVYGAGIESGLRSAAVNGAGYFFFGAFAAALRQVQAAHGTSAKLLEELQIAHQRLREYADRVERMAAIEERNRLAREMHDSLGHRLTVAAVQLEGAQRLIAKDPGRAATMVETVRGQVRDSLSELRRTVAALRQPEQVDIALPQAIQQLATSFEQATGLAVHRVMPQELPELPVAYRLTLYRAAQEGLTNIQRHAQAKEVWLALACQAKTITLTVGDNGIGYSHAARSAGFGLLGLRERAALLGGQVCLEKRPAGGAQLSLSLPWSGQAEEKHG